MKKGFWYLAFFKTILLVLVFILQRNSSFSQSSEKSVIVDMVFYNVENLFDTWDDTLKADEEFLPWGDKHWSIKRYNDKINKLYKTIVAAGGWDSPVLIGLCEVENKKVLNDLIYDTPLSKLEYRFEHFESPDRRGIDVALLYDQQIFKPVFAEPISVDFPNDTMYVTRDILYVKGIFYHSKDTIHLFVNHWPSRRGGQLESEPRRIQAARVLRAKVDSIILLSPNQGIVIMGDFNDQPENKSLLKVLNARLNYEETDSCSLYNLHGISENEAGSYKYRGIWDKFDQIIVSGNMLGTQSKTKVDLPTFVIFNLEFLLIEDEKYLGNKPFATYAGFKYLGGFSDHLPVKVSLLLSNPESVPGKSRKTN
ncbi:MAG: endonuclease [Bacteroidales bacterium]|nr:endonuclease [Bacteroidales bacterium]